MSTESAVRVIEVFPDLLGTYGDRGNSLVLGHRCRRRSQPCELFGARAGEPLPADGDIYLLGGGEDAAQTAATEFLRADGTLAKVIEAGRVVLAVCAGLQILGRDFTGGQGAQVPGLGLVDVSSRAADPRAVGELVLDGGELGELCGFENHAGRTALGPGVHPLGRVRAGIGNDGAADGFVSGRTLGTYMHGPVLARNPVLADRLLEWVVGEVEPLDDPLIDRWRAERIRTRERERDGVARRATE